MPSTLEQGGPTNSIWLSLTPVCVLVLLPWQAVEEMYPTAPSRDEEPAPAYGTADDDAIIISDDDDDDEVGLV